MRIENITASLCLESD